MNDEAFRGWLLLVHAWGAHQLSLQVESGSDAIRWRVTDESEETEWHSTLAGAVAAKALDTASEFEDLNEDDDDDDDGSWQECRTREIAVLRQLAFYLDQAQR